MNYLREIYRYRGFVLGSVKREFSSRYANSMLGAAWLVLQPLAQILVYTLIFANVMRARLPGVDSTFGYSIFLCAGVLTWALFSEIVSKCQTVFLDNANVIKKLSFPRIALPVIVVINAALNFAITFGLFTLFLMISGNFPGLVYLAIIPLLIVQVLLALGVGIIIGVLNVFFRDVGQFFVIALQFWFWLTPIVYPITTLPEWARGLIRLNPMTRLIEAFQDLLVKGKMPDWSSIGIVSLVALVLCAIGLRLFRKHSGELVDEL